VPDSGFQLFTGCPRFIVFHRGLFLLEGDMCIIHTVYCLESARNVERTSSAAHAIYLDRFCLHDISQLLASSSHFKAFLRAFEARDHASLAVLLWMLIAFVAACFADFGAVLADQVYILTIAHHEIHRKSADRRAITVQGNTAFHLNGIFPLTGFCASVACVSTGIARVDAGLVMVM
jgi:hypothetical protein